MSGPRRDWSNWLHARIVFPAIVRLRGEAGVFPAMAQMERAEREDAPSHRQQQQQKLAAILRHARERSTFYAKRIPRDATDADAFALLRELPLISKTDLQQHVEAMRAQPFDGPVTAKITGGSTGQAVKVYKDRVAIGRELAASMAAYGWFGVRIGDRGARFWGSPHTLKRRLRFRAADFAMHRIRFSAFAFDDANLEHYWRRCIAYRPQFFYGYVSMLEEFARFIERRGYDGTQLGLKAITTTSEVLSDVQRALLVRTFGAPVQNEYGCGEVGPIAYECEQGRLHVMTQNLVVELLKTDGTAAGPGETGEIVITDLNNRAMPLIRYAIADFGVWGESCPCGRVYPVFERIWGRAYDFIESPSGQRYHGEYLMYLFEDLRGQGIGIKQFQVTQTHADRLDVRVVLNPDARPDAEERIAKGLKIRLPDMTATVSRQDAIERASSGKMRIIINEWAQRT